MAVVEEREAFTRVGLGGLDSSEMSMVAEDDMDGRALARGVLSELTSTGFSSSLSSRFIGCLEDAP
jgi:hypothetical protein